MLISSRNRICAIVVSLTVLVLAACGGAEARKAHHLERGRQYLAAENYEKARVEFRNALQIAPTDSEARYENGVVSAKLGDLRGAIRFYMAAIDSNSDNVDARAALARMYLLGGRTDLALDTIKPSLEKHPENPLLLTVRAAARNILKDSAGALADAQRAAELAPSSEEATAVLAGIYQSQNQSDKARAVVEAALKRRPDSIELRLMLTQIDASLDRKPQVEARLLEIVKLKPKVVAHRIRLSQFYASEKRLDDAEHVLREAMRDMPDEHELKVALVNFLAGRRSREIAAQELARMISANPQDLPLQFEQAQFDEQGHDYAKAEQVYRRIIAQAKLEAPGLTARDRLAALRISQNDLAGAQELVSEVLASAPRDDDALVMRGNLALAQKDPKAAIADLRAALRDEPNAIGVMRSLARAHVANGEPTLALEILRRATDATPNDVSVRLDLALLTSQVAGAAQAKPMIDELAKQQPNNPAVLETQYKIAMATGDLVTARAAANGFVATEPKSSVGYFYQGTVAEANHRPEDALKLYSTSLELQPDAIEPLRAVARVLVELKRAPEALQRLDATIERFSASAAAPTVKGDLLLSLRQPSEAATAFRMAIERDPKSPIGYGRLATAQLQTHDQDGAITTLRTGIEHASSPEPLQTSLAALYDSIGKPDDAAHIYETALQRNPKSDVAANNLAMLLVTYKKDRGSLERAAQLTARFADSPNPDFLDTYGWVLYKRGEATAAVVALRNVLAKAPQSPIALYHLGMALVLAGQTDAARDNLSHALEVGRPFPGMDEAKATLEKLSAKAAVAPSRS